MASKNKSAKKVNNSCFADICVEVDIVLILYKQYDNDTMIT